MKTENRSKVVNKIPLISLQIGDHFTFSDRTEGPCLYLSYNKKDSTHSYYSYSRDQICLWYEKSVTHPENQLVIRIKILSESNIVWEYL